MTEMDKLECIKDYAGYLLNAADGMHLKLNDVRDDLSKMAEYGAYRMDDNCDLDSVCESLNTIGNEIYSVMHCVERFLYYLPK